MSELTRNEKFLSKNEDNFKKLDERIDALIESKELLMIVASSEMFEGLRLKDKEYAEMNKGVDDYIFYKGRVVVKYVYLAAGDVRLITRDSENIEFLVPCIGGCYPDEPHHH